MKPEHNAVVIEAERSAVITHAHPEAVARAIAVAVAAVQAWRTREARLDRLAFFDLVLPCVSDSEVRTGLRRARDLSAHTTMQSPAAAVGANGIPAEWLAAREPLPDWSNQKIA